MGDEDKQFEASQQKLQKARKEGQVVKSKDFSTALALLVMFIIILKLSPFIWDQISILFVYFEGLIHFTLRIVRLEVLSLVVRLTTTSKTYCNLCESSLIEE